MNVKDWVSENVIWILIALIAANLFVAYWGTVNLGIYSMHNSVVSWDLFRPKKSLLQEQARTLDGTGGAGAGSGALSSANLTLTCSDDDLATAFAAVRPAIVNVTADQATSSKSASLTGAVVFDNPAITFVQEQSLGSGVIVDPRGYIVTNAHVASKAVNLKVVIFSFERTEYPARIVRKDLDNDIAVLKIDAGGPLPAAVLGDSDMIRVAEKVMAVGAPFGLEQTVTAGIISDDSRDLVIGYQAYSDMIQTDAAINRGNSGGPLVNIKGEVIGITTAIYAPTGVFLGVGFAIPINKVKPIVKDALTR